jgi:hypothetical protein
MSSFDPSRALHERLPVLGLVPSAPLGSRRVLRESVPIAALLLLWTVLSWLAFEPFVSWAVRTTGAVVAAGYVVVCGVRLGREAAPFVDDDALSVLGQNVYVALAPAAWFLTAVLVPVAADLWELFGLPGLFVSPAGDLVRVCALSGLGTALLLVVAGATAALGDTEP